jgi:threonine synthase
VWAWLRSTDVLEEELRSDYEVDVAVPSGNFGNIYAGHLARSMGVPIRRLILATNENNVLEEFFSTGVYRPRGRAETLATSSPSMDISKASNLERFIWQLLGPEEFTQRWPELEAEGALDLSDHLDRLNTEFGFVSGSSSHADRLAAIGRVHSAADRLIDPHTADGVTVALRFMEPDFPTLVMETAKAAKFGETVTEALGRAQPDPPEITKLLALPQHVDTIANDEAPLRALIEANALHA